jgi:hypothetical protein
LGAPRHEESNDWCDALRDGPGFYEWIKTTDHPEIKSALHLRRSPIGAMHLEMDPVFMNGSKRLIIQKSKVRCT